MLAAYSAVVAHLSTASVDGVIPTSSIRRLRTLIRGEINLLRDASRKVISKNLPAAAEFGEKTMRDLLQGQVGASRFTVLTQKTADVNETVARQLEDVGYDGKPITDSIDLITTGAYAAIVSYVSTSILRDETIQRINRRVRQHFTGEKVKSLRPPITSLFPNLARTTRTEYAFAYSEAQKEFARRVPQVTGFRWFLSAAHPRPDICDTLAGHVYPPNARELGIFPAHVNCFCFLEPVFA